MMKMNKNKKGQAGFVITVELLLIVTVLVIGLLAGWTKVRDQAVAELGDTGDAIGAIDQSYSIEGTQWSDSTDIAATSGFGFADAPDQELTRVGGDGGVIDYEQTIHQNAVTGTTGSFETSSLF